MWHRGLSLSRLYPLRCSGVDLNCIGDEGLKYLSFEGEKELYLCQCLNVKEELPTLTDDEREALFSNVKHYPPPEGIKEEITNVRKVSRRRFCAPDAPPFIFTLLSSSQSMLDHKPTWGGLGKGKYEKVEEG